MRIKYSAMNKLQHDILNGPLNALGASPSDVEHTHWCHDCQSAWTHQNPSCTDPDNITSICPNCEEAVLANEQNEDERYNDDHIYY